MVLICTFLCSTTAGERVAIAREFLQETRYGTRPEMRQGLKSRREDQAVEARPALS